MLSYSTFNAIGTTWNIGVPDTITAHKKKILFDAIHARIEIFDKTYSRFRDDSLVTQISHTAGKYTLPDDAQALMSLYKEMYEITDGLMTPLIGQTLVDAGYDSKYSLKPKDQITKAPTWDDTIEYSHPILTVKIPVVLDFGAIGKGYLIDIVAYIIRDQGIEKFVIDAGGDIIHKGPSPLRVGLEDPSDATKVIGVASIENQSICGSSGNRRAWNKFHHIINPHTTESPRHIKALWTVASSTALADALSTALFFTSPQKLETRYTFQYAIMAADGSVTVSTDFPGDLFKA